MGHEVYTMGDFAGFHGDGDLDMAGLEDGIIDAFLGIDQPDATSVEQAAQQTNDPLLRLATGLPIETTRGAKPGDQGPSGVGVPAPGAQPSRVATGGAGPPAVTSSGGITAAVGNVVGSAVDKFTDLGPVQGILDGTVFGVSKKVALGVGVGLGALLLLAHYGKGKKGGARRRRG